MQILSCDEADKCLNPSERSLTLPENKSFRKRINNLITHIAEKIKDKDGVLTAEQKELITKTSIPLYSSMVAKQAYFKNSLANSRDAELYTEIIAIDILYNYLDDILKEVEEQSKQVTNFNQENIDKFTAGIQKARKEIVQFQTDNRKSLDVAIKILNNQRMIEEILSESMSSNVKGNVLWANSF
jgi:conjugative transfer pilus assembly protein TraH